MTTELAKQMLDACYLAKRARDLLPPLPQGVQPSYIQYLDIIQKLEESGAQARVSDISDALHLPRPGVTRTVKEMEGKGYLKKQASATDARVTQLSVTEEGRALSRRYDADYFPRLLTYLDDITEEEAQAAVRTIEKFYRAMERSSADEKR